MNWLITGGCGFIGRALITRLLEQGGQNIRVLDNLSVGLLEDLEQLGPVSPRLLDDLEGEWGEGISFVKGDIRVADDLLRASKGAEVLVHLAANTGVFPSVQDPRFDAETNVFGVLNALEACRANAVTRMVFASSGAPLGVQKPPLHEELAPHPASPYGASKLAGEGYCSAYFHCFGVESVVLRFGNVYGEGSTLKASVVAKFIKQALAGEKLEIYGDGSQTRDFIHISDLVNAIVAAATKTGIGGETFQIATASETTVGELTDKLVAVLQSEGVTDVEYFNGEARQGDVQRNFSDTSKAKRMMGWQAQVGLDEGLRRTVRFFLQTCESPAGETEISQ
jgi:UDP-glucose 4-epimerase